MLYDKSATSSRLIAYRQRRSEKKVPDVWTWWFIAACGLGDVGVRPVDGVIDMARWSWRRRLGCTGCCVLAIRNRPSWQIRTRHALAVVVTRCRRGRCLDSRNCYCWSASSGRLRRRVDVAGLRSASTRFVAHHTDALASQHLQPTTKRTT